MCNGTAGPREQRLESNKPDAGRKNKTSLTVGPGGREWTGVARGGHSRWRDVVTGSKLWFHRKMSRLTSSPAMVTTSRWTLALC